jgi:IPT/TIG domain/Matrixin
MTNRSGNRQSPLLSCQLALLLLVVSSPLVFGFVKSGPTWQSLPVAYRINVLGLPSSTNGSEFNAIEKAFDTWQNISTSTIAFTYQGTTTIQNGGSDGTNVMSFRDEDYPFASGVIAITLSTSSSGHFTDADILFNPALSFSTSGATGTFDIQAIATHEIGHFLGLDHTAIVSATMNPTVVPPPDLFDPYPRFLRSDDIIGASSLYPTASFASTTGGLSGRITKGGANVFGAHVVALDSQGNPIVSTLSQLDGTYQIVGLPAGSYSVYAEPLDEPVTGDNIGGQFDSSVDTDFTTTFLGDTMDYVARQIVGVAAGSTTSNQDISVLPTPANTFNLTSPSSGVYAPEGVSGPFKCRGDGISAGTTFFITGPGIVVGTPSFPSGGVAQVPVTVSSTAPMGLRTLFARRADGLTALSGGFIVTGEPPDVSSVSPSSGGREGGTSVTVAGSGFVSGTSAYLAGLPLLNLVVVNSTTIQGTTPTNAAGNLDLLVINPDGNSAILRGAFEAIAPPPTVSSISPLSGPPTTVVTIKGTNFDDKVENVVVRFNGTQATVTSASSTQIVTVVPFGAASGAVSVTVFDQNVTGPVFTVTAPPVSTNHPDLQFQFVDASSGGTKLSFPGDSDDSAAQVALPFDFTLFSSTFVKGTSISVATNGWLSLNSSVPIPAEWQNGSLPGTTVPREGFSSGTTGSLPSNLIAPFFDDLILQNPGSGVFVRVLGTAPNRQWVIEWKDASIIDENGNVLNSHLTFEAVFFEGNNDVLLQYQTLTGSRSQGDSATVGIQNATRNQAVQASFNQPRLFEGAVMIFRFNPSNATYTLSQNLSTNEITQFIPFVTDTSQFRTNLGLTNVSAQAAFATITLFDATGNSVGTSTTSVPAGGLMQLNNVIRLIRGASQVTNSSASVVISSDQTLVPYATQIDNVSSDPSLETGKSTGKTQLLIPSTTSVSPFRSSLILQNVGSSSATVNLRQHDITGAVRKELNITIPAAGFFQTDDLHATLGLSGIYGPLEITSTNSIPLVATSRVFSPNSGASGFFEGIDLSTVTNTAVIPITQDTGSFRSNLGINNLGNTQANVTVSLYGTSGALLGSQNVTVPARGLLQLNHVNRILTGTSGISNTTGYIRLSSDQPVAGFCSVINNISNDPGLAPSLLAGDTRLIIPSATNVNQFRSALTIINLGSSVSARVRLTARDTSGSTLAQNQNIVISANGIYNVEDILTNLGISGSYGPIQIESLDGVPLAATSRVYSISNDTSGFFLAQPF